MLTCSNSSPGTFANLSQRVSLIEVESPAPESSRRVTGRLQIQTFDSSFIRCDVNGSTVTSIASLQNASKMNAKRISHLLELIPGHVCKLVPEGQFDRGRSSGAGIVPQGDRTLARFRPVFSCNAHPGHDRLDGPHNVHHHLCGQLFHVSNLLELQCPCKTTSRQVLRSHSYMLACLRPCQCDPSSYISCCEQNHSCMCSCVRPCKCDLFSL
jgi:hypothetical protein